MKQILELKSRKRDYRLFETPKISFRYLIGLFFICFTLQLTAQDETWKGYADSVWTNDANWLDMSAPTGIINGTLTFDTTSGHIQPSMASMPDTIMATKLEINENFTIPADKFVLINTMTPGGTSGGVVVDSTLTIANGGKLVVKNTNGKGLEVMTGGTVVVNDTLVVDASSGVGLSLNILSELTNSAQGKIFLRGNTGAGIENSGKIQNDGNFLITDSGSNGIINMSSSEFINNDIIQIFHSNGSGLQNADNAIFTNEVGAKLAISESTEDGIEHGLFATFNSKGTIAVDNAGESGIFITHDFISDGDSVLIGTNHPLTGTGSSAGCTIIDHGIFISATAGMAGNYSVSNASTIIIGNSTCSIGKAGINNRGTLTTDGDSTSITIRNTGDESIINTGTITHNNNANSDCIIIDVDDVINTTGTFNNSGIILTSAPLDANTGTANALDNNGFIADENGAFFSALTNPRATNLKAVVENAGGIIVAPFQDASYTSPISDFLITGLGTPYENGYAVGGFGLATFNNNNNELSLNAVTTDYIIPYEVQKSSDGTRCANLTAAINFDTAPTDEIACNGNINVSLNAFGTATLQPDMILESTFADYSGYIVEILTGNNAGTNQIDCSYLGKTVEVMVTAPGTSGNRCWGKVTIEDKLGPVLTIADTFFYCNQEYAPANLGFPVGTDVCSSTISYTYADKDSILTLCGEDASNSDTLRIITRTFTGRDQFWNESVITQTIYELRPTISDVVFPSSYIGSDALQCNSSNTATAVTGAPYFRIGTDSIPVEASCKFGVNMEEKVYDLGCPGKQRIERTWTVMDWCNLASGAAISSATQIIDIIDTIPPTFDSIKASDIVILSTQSHKCMVTIRPPAPQNVQDACSGTTYRINGPSGTIFNDPLDSLMSIPFDTTTLEYIITDSCGNETRDTVTFILKDEVAPLALAQELTINLVDSLGNTWVYASSFDAGSSDNCSELDSVLISKDSINFSDRLAFGCEDVGVLTLTLKVVDEAGNSSIVTREVTISDNGMFCGGDGDGDGGDEPIFESVNGEEESDEEEEEESSEETEEEEEEVKGQAAIAGHIQNENGETVGAVSIAIGGYEMSPEVTGADGSFMFEEVPLDGDYMITPEKDMHHANGITTFDIVLLSKHVLGLKPLDSPYKMIAADINHSGNISAYDMVLLRQVILGIKSDFPNNTSWRFIDADYEFIDPANPLAENYPEAYEIKDLATDMMSLDFVAVKIGDLNNTASVNQLQTTESRSTKKSLNFQIEEQSKKSGEKVTVDFKASNFQSILGYQFTLDFDGNDLKFEQIQMGTQTGFENFNLSMIQRGIITTSWNESEAIDLAKDEVLFSVVFEAKNDVQISEAISISSDITAAEAYTGTEEVINVNLEVKTPYIPAEGFKLHQNVPNPFTGETIIGFDLPTASATTLTIFDMSGKTVKVQKGTHTKGYNQILLDGKSFDEYGMFYYQLETNQGIETKKMILLKR